MLFGRTTLSKFVIEHTRGQHSEMGALLIDVAAAVKTISALVGKGAPSLEGILGHNMKLPADLAAKALKELA